MLIKDPFTYISVLAGSSGSSFSDRKAENICFMSFCYIVVTADRPILNQWFGMIVPT